MNLSVVGASSTCELVFDTLFSLENTNNDWLTKEMAECLYTGLMTDTGNFRFSATTPHVHEVLSILLEKGVQPDKIDNLVNNSFSESRLKFFGYCANEKMTIIPEKKLAFIAVSQQELYRFNLGTGDTEGLVNEPMKISDVKVSVLIKEDKDKVKMSFRSKEDINVADFAKTFFNGGGHKNAAGGAWFGSLDETIQRLRDNLDKLSI